MESLLFIIDTLPEKEEVISMFSYLAKLPSHIIALEMKNVSKLIYTLISQIYRNDVCNIYLNALISIRKNRYILLSGATYTSFYKIYVKEPSFFTILLITALKYTKHLFTNDGNNIKFLQALVKTILNFINLVQPQSLEILKLLETILKKREDILTDELALIILNCMNKVASSPLMGFKRRAYNISKIALKSMPQQFKKILCNFDNFPIKGVDVNDILNLFEGNELLHFNTITNKQILKLFASNTESRNGSFYYEKVVSVYSFVEFTEKIWPFYDPYLQNFNEEGEFQQSFLKYWIPISVKHYKKNIYTFLCGKVDYKVQAYVLLELRKQGFYEKKFEADNLKFIKFSKTSEIALKVITTYTKKCTIVDLTEIEAVQYYIHSYPNYTLSDEIRKSFEQFISQIFFTAHINLQKNIAIDLNTYRHFLEFIYKFCFARINGDYCELAAQLLEIIWHMAKGSSFDLWTNYNIDRENIYEEGANLFYIQLRKNEFWQKSFDNNLLLNKIEKSLQGQLTYCPNLIKLSDRYSNLRLHDLSIIKLLDSLQESVFLQSSEIIRIYSKLILGAKNKQGCNYENDIFELINFFKKNLQSENLFNCVLIFNIFLSMKIYNNINFIELIEDSLKYFERIIDNNLHVNLNIKTNKVLESFVNNSIECLMESKNYWQNFHKNKILSQLCKIIKKSNMKKSISLATNALNYFGKLMEQNDDERKIKTKILSRTLDSLYGQDNQSKIRRSPETRLVIHSLSITDRNPTKPSLIWSIKYMLRVLGDPSAGDFTLSSTLHSLEVLVSDNGIHHITLPYIPVIIMHCITHFNNKNWVVRNADLQLLKSLIERFLGVSLEHNTRPKSVEDLFILFPNLCGKFCDILSKSILDNSTLIVMLFFSESQIKNNIFLDDSLRNNFEKFRHIFAGFIKNHSIYSCFAINSFTALCFESMIPQVIAEIILYIKAHFRRIPANIVVSLIRLLQDLFQKYKLVQFSDEFVENSIVELITFLKQFQCFYFNFLALRLSSVEELLSEIVDCLNFEIDYKSRIWLNKYIPYVIFKLNTTNLVTFLHQILCLKIPEFLQIQILAVLVERLSDIKSNLTDIVEVLILKLTKLQDSCKYLIMSYSKTILLFYEISNNFRISQYVINEIRSNYDTNYIYKNFIYTLCLTHFDKITDHDLNFLRQSLNRFMEYLADDEILYDLATCIKYLYKFCSFENRADIIKLIFYLLLRDSTAFEMCKFISFLHNCQCSSILHSVTKFLDFKTLSKHVGETKLTFKLLSEFYCYIEGLSDELVESDSYYLIENDVSLPRLYIKQILIKSLCEASN